MELRDHRSPLNVHPDYRTPNQTLHFLNVTFTVHKRYFDRGQEAEVSGRILRPEHVNHHTVVLVHIVLNGSHIGSQLLEVLESFAVPGPDSFRSLVKFLFKQGVTQRFQHKWISLK